MKNVRIAFGLYEGTMEDLPPRYQDGSCHIIFDVNMGENYRRKDRMVAGGQNTTRPSPLTYKSVVSSESVSIASQISAFNDLKLLACYIHNGYLTEKCQEKI